MPDKKRDIEILEKVQKHATKSILRLKNETYIESVKVCNVNCQHYVMQIQVVRIKMYKILADKHDKTIIPTFNRIWNSNTKTNDLRLQKGHAKCDLWKCSFAPQVADVWNS